MYDKNMPSRKSNRASHKASRKVPGKTSRKASRKVPHKTSRKASRKVPRKTSRKVPRKTSRKASRKVPRKTSRKVPRKTSRKASRKVSRKTSRKVSRKVTRKTSRKVPRKTQKGTELNIEDSQNYLENRILKESNANKEALNALGESQQKLFFIDKTFYLIGTIKRIIGLSANVLREKHFNRKTQADKIDDPEFDKYKVEPSTVYFDRKNVRRAFEIILKFLRENPRIHSSYNPYLEIEYDNKDIYYNMYQNMIDKENKEFEEIEKEEF
jgi:hypothetical protein